ncbi:hypothetical protein [Anoxybacillus flavithermus]|uniref:hypothetical protein n=1 Tax=Anoxybacillus flavithermus TaxID=33934 RepID=UPI00190F7A5D|nr:hypothetical protein [Anoxybacillus flavithermus]
MYMKRRKHSKEFKLQVVKEALEVGNKALVAIYIQIGILTSDSHSIPHAAQHLIRVL